MRFDQNLRSSETRTARSAHSLGRFPDAKVANTVFLVETVVFVALVVKVHLRFFEDLFLVYEFGKAEIS